MRYLVSTLGFKLAKTSMLDRLKKQNLIPTPEKQESTAASAWGGIRNLLKEFAQFLTTTVGRPKVCVDLNGDHVELAETYIILGLCCEWWNKTEEEIVISKVQLTLHMRNSRELKEPIVFHNQGSFERVSLNRAITKRVGVRALSLPPQERIVEHMRFYNLDTFDLEAGKYIAEITAFTDSQTHIHFAELIIENRMKYRTHKAWVSDV